jgi:Enoyl-CoA hydratase/isomerase
MSAPTNGRGSESWWQSWTHLHVARPSPGHCRVTFDHPPVNAIDETTVDELAELVGLIEEDEDLNVVVFDSANPECFLGDLERRTQAWQDVLERLARAPVISIAAIRGRAGGAGSEFALACDLRFVARERALLGALEILFAGGDRLPADERLDDEIEEIAEQLALLDHDVIARAKSCVDRGVDVVVDARRRDLAAAAPDVDGEAGLRG